MNSLLLSTVRRSQCFKNSLQNVLKINKRNLNLLEYQSKTLLDECGVAIQKFRVLEGKQDSKVLDDFSEYYLIKNYFIY